MTIMTDNFERQPMFSITNKAGDRSDHQYGRRIEPDRSWTVYHVFTGVPADSNDGATLGLNRAEATDRMILLNRRDDERTAGRPAPKHEGQFGPGPSRQ